ncbi:hypothetical protein M422DRAFT_58872 [Sphaerobolus stellatus SS14]|nr:hypothetical protein M422DRAFT_58872 [Sphaerobolus stellatus SS14]
MSVVGPYPGRAPQRTSSTQSSAPAQDQQYYGHQEVAVLCRRFVCALFSCPDRLPATTTTSNPTLAIFIAYALHRTRLHVSVTFTALFLLSRLKSKFPAARGSSGHRLFISAFMIASKVVCDDTYSNKSWTVVGQGMFSLREINQMEREMCGYLEWHLNVSPEDLQAFEVRVRKDYGPNGTCPPFVHPPQPAAPQESPTIEAGNPTPSPPAAHQGLVPAPMMTPPESPRPLPMASRGGKARRPTVDTQMSTPPLADTPTPESSQHGPRTPPSDDEDDPTTIVSGDYPHDYSGDPMDVSRASSALSMSSAASMAPKSKQGRDQSFAFPSRTVW